MIVAGKAFLSATDDLGMQAQGAMWVYDHVLDDWRYYLVTSLVDSLGRRKTYKLLLDAFEKAHVPTALTIEDIHLGSPAEQFFQFISSTVAVDGSIAIFKDCKFNDVQFDGAIYRSVKKPPSPQEAHKIEKLFSKKIKELASIDQ